MPLKMHFRLTISISEIKTIRLHFFYKDGSMKVANLSKD